MSSARSRPRRGADSAAKTRATPDSQGSAGASAAATGLRLHEEPTRLTSLLREHQQLLAKIRQKKRELQRLTERLQTTFNEASRRIAPLLATIAQLDRQLHALFAELLARKRQPRSVTAALQRIYNILQQGGVLSVATPAAAPDPDATASGRAAAADPQAGGHSAARPGGSEGATGQSLRGLFYRLAAAMHPDRAQHEPEPEKQRRTEAMKELTRAYQDGDLARLLELERLWLLTGDLPAARDELDQRCATLLRTNAALRQQLEQVKKELKGLRRSPQAELLSDIERSARLYGPAPADDPLADAVREAQEHGEHLRELLAFIGSFRDGEIGLAGLLAGPPSAAEPQGDLDLEVEFLDFEEELLRGARPRRRGKARHRAARRGPASDIPF